MKKFFGVLSITLLVAFLVACGNNDENAHIPGEPDVISSIRSNNDENLVVIANRDEIEDKVEFAKLLVKMCQDNSFQTIKFSTDFGYATSLDMRVYLWKDEVEGNDPIMTVEFKPIEWNQEYDIVNNPEMFELYVDGELIESE
ncbi:hypothetical protein [Mediterraneibacter gnavus]|uniref:hypothetical protein n=1 Tax=Mediterraneibacter gnavus TaxID=33038 RepID=UPI001FA8BFF4|nr:hypothetical protein [Mediterraneibacter gnavus]